MPPIINEEKCIKCTTCVQICPMDVIKVVKNELVVTYPDECWPCRACAIDCPAQAIVLRYPLPHMLLHIEHPSKKLV